MVADRFHRPSRRALLLALTLVGVSLSSVLAIEPRSGDPLDHRVIPPPRYRHQAVVVTASDRGPAADLASGFRKRHPGRWQIQFDPGTGRPTLISGEGIPVLPGAGNLLTFPSVGLMAGGVSISDVEGLGRGFLQQEPALFLPSRGELRLNSERSGSFDGGRLWYLDFDWYVDDLLVEGARVFLRINQGNLIQMGTARLSAAGVHSPPKLTESQARERLFDHLDGMAPEDELVNPGSLVLLPYPRPGTAPWGEGIFYRPVWRFAFRRGERAPTWTGEVDARSGEVLAFFDANRYGRVTAGIYPRSVNDTEIEYPVSRPRVVYGGTANQTTLAGTYPYAGGPVSTSFTSQLFQTRCFDCQSPEQAFAFLDSGTGDLKLGLGGFDQFANGVSTPAERNTFFHLHRVRDLAKKWLDIPWLDAGLEARVNLDDVCNAFWDGVQKNVNFYRSGLLCNNAGEISDIIFHEYGHGLDQFTNLGDGSTGEGMGDIVSMHVSHDAQVAPFFWKDGSSIRDLDPTTSGVRTISNLSSFCPDCSGNPGLNCVDGPGGFEVHCEGRVYGQAQWDLAGLLTAKHGFNTGWQISEELFFLSLPQVDTFFPGQPQDAYDAYLAVDDDNGNLADGTPNSAEIFSAFDAHEIAGASWGASSSGCSRPAEPVVTASSQCGKVVLDWPSVAGATSYRVMRAEFSPTTVYLPLADLSTSATSYEDDTVQAGASYYYVVEAKDSSGCRSTIEGSVVGTAAGAASLDAVSIIWDDIPAGNRSGFVDPGEAVDPEVTVSNAAPAATASFASGTLTASSPGVSVITSSSNYGVLPPGASSAGTPYRVDLESSVTCGVSTEFQLSLADGGSCAARTAYFSGLVGERVPVFSDDFETDLGWVVTTSGGGPAASSGFWVRGDPNGTDFQPESDASPAGSECFFTGQNTNNNNGDIDGGETTLLSPVIDLSGIQAARLSYLRWWGNSDPGVDAGDVFEVEVSDDGGSSWVAVETLTSEVAMLGWHPVEIRIEDFLTLPTGQFRMRFRAADGPPFNHTVEAALDEVKLEEVVCDPTPPCFVEPTFSGLATLGPGASCAEADLTWGVASTNCTNAEITYNIYRDTSSGFTPSPSNLVAPGLTGTSFHDTLLTPGVEYFYLARAEDSRSGEDTNGSELSFVATASPDTVSPVFAGLSAVVPGPNCGENVLSWSAAAETCSAPAKYEVYRFTTSGFTPSTSNQIASTLTPGFADATTLPGQNYFYVVRAVDASGNSDSNLLEGSSASAILPLVAYQEDFEPDDGSWVTTAPNDAITGNWEWGDPEGTGVQPEEDHTPGPGVNAWITGLLGLGDPGGNDVDGGTTTLVSPNLDLTSLSSGILELALYFSNDQGANPGEDPLLIDVSNDAGSAWTSVLNTVTSTPGWQVQAFGLDGLFAGLSDQFQIRVTAADLGVGGSLVEAGVDDVRIFEPDGGCSGCPTPVTLVGNVLVTLSGDDLLLDWTADPINATSYNVYLLSGFEFSQALRAGNTSTKSFLHEGAALLLGEDFFYRVTAVDACGQESALE